MDKTYYVYILSSKKNGTLYIGVTSNLIKRVWQHKNKVASGFTSEYDVNHLVYFEQYSDVHDAIRREKQLKKWNRDWKVELIEKNNPRWEDLYVDIK
jgi:putative endonuclease